MRTAHPALFAVVGLGLLGWSTRLSLASQDCCHHSAGTPNQAVRAASGARMPSVTVEEARREFNASEDKVRILALLSPTCPDCRSGHVVVGRVLKKFSSPALRAILIWLPMRAGDTPAAAAQQTATETDARIWQGWDPAREIGKLLGETLDLHEIAWDVYLVYRPGIRWEARQPPPPTFWMHQLAGADPKLLLCEDPARLSAEVGRLLEQAP